MIYTFFKMKTFNISSWRLIILKKNIAKYSNKQYVLQFICQKKILNEKSDMVFLTLLFQQNLQII